MVLHFVSLFGIYFMVGKMVTICKFFIPAGIVDSSLVSIGGGKCIIRHHDVFPLVLIPVFPDLFPYKDEHVSMLANESCILDGKFSFESWILPCGINNFNT